METSFGSDSDVRLRLVNGTMAEEHCRYDKVGSSLVTSKRKILVPVSSSPVTRRMFWVWHPDGDV